jgi:hypothetical protein
MSLSSKSSHRKATLVRCGAESCDNDFRNRRALSADPVRWSACRRPVPNLAFGRTRSHLPRCQGHEKKRERLGREGPLGPPARNERAGNAHRTGSGNGLAHHLRSLRAEPRHGPTRSDATRPELPGNAEPQAGMDRVPVPTLVPRGWLLHHQGIVGERIVAAGVWFRQVGLLSRSDRPGTEDHRPKSCWYGATARRSPGFQRRG